MLSGFRCKAGVWDLVVTEWILQDISARFRFRFTGAFAADGSHDNMMRNSAHKELLDFFRQFWQAYIVFCVDVFLNRCRSMVAAWPVG